MPKAYSDYTNYLHRLTAYGGYTNYYHRPMAYGGYTHYYHRQGLEPGDISRKLKQEGIKATGRGIGKFLAKCIESGSVARKSPAVEDRRRRQPRFELGLHEAT